MECEGNQSVAAWSINVVSKLAQQGAKPKWAQKSATAVTLAKDLQVGDCEFNQVESIFMKFDPVQ